MANKTIFLNESQLITLKEAKGEVTFYGFTTKVKDFMKQLLKDPFDETFDPFFGEHGIEREKLLNTLLNRNILIKSTDIDERDTDKGKKSMMIVKYKVPSENFDRKMKRLYTELFECKDNDSIMLDECDAGGAMGGAGGAVGGIGDVSAGGATNAAGVGNYQYDVPFGGMMRRDFFAPALKRKDGRGGSISVNSTKKKKNKRNKTSKK